MQSGHFDASHLVLLELMSLSVKLIGIIVVRELTYSGDGHDILIICDPMCELRSLKLSGSLLKTLWVWYQSYRQRS